MLTEDRQHVAILRNLYRDLKLPKFIGDISNMESTPEHMRHGSSSDFSRHHQMNGNIVFGSSGRSMMRDSQGHIWDGISFQTRRQFRNRFEKYRILLYIKIRLLFSRNKMSISDFFDKIKESKDKLESTEKKIQDYNKIIDHLEETHQSMAQYFLRREISILEQEQKLVEHGCMQYITEETLVEFTKKSKKGLRLDYLCDFERPIPEDVRENLIKTYDWNVFDNYLILHYDPEAAKKVKIVEEQPKDPILFGVICESNKLYYIDDWIDEYCNLTYKDVIAAVGKDEELTDAEGKISTLMDRVLKENK